MWVWGPQFGDLMSEAEAIELLRDLARFVDASPRTTTQVELPWAKTRGVIALEMAWGLTRLVFLVRRTSASPARSRWCRP